ncbi:cold shock domain-containing protein [Microvirga arsenatis]|uniref:Cold shock domain-containing protein n=1 Tax=Microvirga arsenatis TaxID=2692265 RepID=A0ABW9Z160_9HYPH|nr:cold shock domain-containing protein [Microvirga arsenatis]NBJ13373.1 cold shock domain-containing protein [Microvirga arsenatis]NBJ26408.1 cold shock domain-containing protein [Microvirga arsenatis]
MAHTIQRLTMYALISALERDLRDFLALHVAPLVPPDKLLPDTVKKKAEERYLKDNPDGLSNLDDLLEYLDLGEEIQAIRANDGRLDDLTRSYIKRYYLALEGIIPTRNRVMHSRPLEFDDHTRLTDLASELIKSHRALWANLRTTRRELERNPEFVTALTIPDTVDENTKILHNLPQVEFDDTGFVGREKELNELKRALLGSYPIITVIGEGGLGKTALALKACYDLLDDNEAGLDAIVWTTAKTTKLTLNEIEVIEGAISSSLGIIESATSLLGRQSETSAIDDLIMHLENNKILLVIDNLETVIDQNIRELVRRVPQGSRIMFTTRIGLGAFDFPIPLSPLNKKEAAFYFRRTARVWGAADMASAQPNVVEGYCERLQHNPLFIKWFIQSVRAGKRPTTLTSDPTVLLQFCLQNVFNSLSVEARTVASTLAGVNGPQTVASLAFFTDLDSIKIQSALSVLITSNLVSAERGRSSEDEDRYLLSPLARMYIQKIIRPSIEEQRRLIAKQNALRSAQEEFTAKAGADIFDINNVYVRDKDDYIVAKILTRAIESIFKGSLSDAEEQIRKANDLSPNYFEVHRVAAMLHIAQEDIFSAEAEYEAAVSLASERAALRVWFAGFISRHLGDQERALEQLLKAEELAPNSAYVKIECARVLQYLRKLDEAEKRLRAIQDIDQLPSRMRRVHLDLCIQNEFRRAEIYASQQEYLAALQSLEQAKQILDGAPSALVDHRTAKNIERARRRQIPALERAFKGLPEYSRLTDIVRWMLDAGRALDPIQTVGDEVSASELSSADAANSLPNRGRLSQLHKNYGFVDTGGTRLYFNRAAWMGESNFFTVEEGTIVEFDIGTSDRGPCAVNVRPIQEEVASKNETGSKYVQGQVLTGSIKSLQPKFGFIRLDDGNDLFFHHSNCTSGTKFKKLQIGERVRCKFVYGHGNRPSGTEVELYSGL